MDPEHFTREYDWWHVRCFATEDCSRVVCQLVMCCLKKGFSLEFKKPKISNLVKYFRQPEQISSSSEMLTDQKWLESWEWATLAVQIKSIIGPWNRKSEWICQFATICRCKKFNQQLIYTKEFTQLCFDLESTLCGQENSIQMFPNLVCRGQIFPFSGKLQPWSNDIILLSPKS